ncbi:MAG: metal-sensing transcriptional repressor [Mogibacterium sp.]|nr:metal-sensing transcriptional repressor [Mogibacterium sp.]
METCSCERKKKRSEDEYKALMNRLKRIEGQIRGVEGMLENDAYCPDILIQVSAINSALNSFNKELLAEHLRTCVKTDIQNGDDGAVDEFVKVMQKLMK